MVSFYLIWGKYFGFPKCCTHAFNEYDKHKHSNVPYGVYVGKRKLTGTGFIPCTQCESQKTEHELKMKINQNRICQLSFPKEPKYEKSLLFIFESERFSLFEKASFALQLRDADWDYVCAILYPKKPLLMDSLMQEMDSVMAEYEANNKKVA